MAKSLDNSSKYMDYHIYYWRFIADCDRTSLILEIQSRSINDYEIDNTPLMEFDQENSIFLFKVKAYKE
jgi:hypothetical protein